MFNERLFSIFFDFPFLQLDLFLFLDLVHVVFSLDASLLGQGRGFFLELFLSGFFEIGLDSLPLGLFKLFSFSRLSLTLLKGSLCSQSIDFSLSVSSLFLELSQTLDLSFFFFSQPLGLLLLLILSLVFFALMFSDGLIVIFFLLDSLLFFEQCLSISLSSLLHKQIDFSPLSLMRCLILFSHLFDVSLKLNLFLISQLLLLHSQNSSLLDLVNNDLGTLFPSLSFADFSLLLL